MATPKPKAPRIMVVGQDFLITETHSVIQERDGDLCLAPESVFKIAAQNCPVCKGQDIRIAPDFTFTLCECTKNDL